MRASALALGALGALAALPACGGTAPGPRTAHALPAASATSLPPLEYRLTDGAPWTSQAALGHVIVIDVWATYCKPCRKAFPKLGRLAASHADLVVVGISVDEEDATVATFLREVPAAFPIARDPKATVQTGPLAIRQIPTVLVVDRAGRIRYRAENLTETDYDALPDLVEDLLAEPAPGR